MLYGWKVNSMLTNFLAACVHLTITVSKIERYLWKKSSFSHSPLAFDAPFRGGVPSEYRHPVWYWKTRMMGLPNGAKKLSISITGTCDRQTDGRTDGHLVTAYTRYAYASRSKNQKKIMGRGYRGHSPSPDPTPLSASILAPWALGVPVPFYLRLHIDISNSPQQWWSTVRYSKLSTPRSQINALY